MSSVKREYSLPAAGITHVEVTSGTGTSLDYAQVYIDPRKSSVFRVDISNLAGDNNGISITLDTFPGAPGAVPGKEITILFSGNPNRNEIRLHDFTDNFGPNAYNNYVNLYGNDNGVPTAIKLMSDGTDFVMLSTTYNNN